MQVLVADVIRAAKGDLGESPAVESRARITSNSQSQDPETLRL